MDKVKVSEIAVEAGLKSKEALDKLNTLGLGLKSASSTVELDMAEKLLAFLQQGIVPPELQPKKEVPKEKPKEEMKEVPKEKPKQQEKKSEPKLEVKKDTQESLADAVKNRRTTNAIRVVSRARDKNKTEEELKEEARAEEAKKAPEIEKPHKIDIKAAFEKHEIKEAEAAALLEEENRKKKKKLKKVPAPKKTAHQHKIDLLSERGLGESDILEEDEIVLPDFDEQVTKEEKSEANKKEVEKAKFFKQNKYTEQKTVIRRSSRKAKKPPKQEEKKEKPEELITIPEDIRAYEFADKIGVSIAEIIKKLFGMGMMITKNDFLDKDIIEILADEFGVQVKTTNTFDELDYVKVYDDVEDEHLEERAPVVTIMGHVDHGKTTLLDSIRNTKVASGEAGGITQHIGAYTVTKNGKYITFIDTPGHEAFTEMRARGAEATDIVIIVVAADDGVRPQTEEALSHAKAAEVPIIIAVNKMDKPEANIDLVKSQLSERGFSPVDWGGEYEFVPVSAKVGTGIEELLEIILIHSELLNLKANPKKPAKAVVVESSLEKGRGPVATLIIQDGTLKVGDSVVADTTCGRVRALSDDLGNPITEIGPSMVGVITGLDEVPQAGSILIAVDNDTTAKEFARKRAEHIRQKELSKSTKVSFEELGERVKEGSLKSLPIILKTDVQGSLEAIKASLEKLKNEEVKINVIHQAVGGITESDLTLASASDDCVILGFNVRPTGLVKTKAKNQNIEIKTYTIIYDLLDDIKTILGGMMSPSITEETSGQAEVREVFNIPKLGNIAGCLVSDGTINRGFRARVIRDGVVIYESNISSLKRFKDDAKEVAKGFECGIGIENFNDLKPGDVIETFKRIEKQRTF